MLIACTSCQRQFDVGSHRPGAVLRCFCGARLTVPEPRPRDLRMLHCSSCGAGLPPGATACGFCGSAVALGEKGLGDTCPSCLSRMVAGARFCSSCGLGIRPTAVLRALTDHACPRCSEALSECDTGALRFVECTGCGGLWLGEDLFTSLTSSRERAALPPGLARRGEGPAATRDPAADLREVRYLPCPVCAERMHRQNFGRSSGVIVDWCKGHGFWFDADELDAVLAFVQAGGLDRQREREKEQLAAERRRVEGLRRDRALIHANAGGRTVRATGFDLVEALTDLVGRWLR